MLSLHLTLGIAVAAVLVERLTGYPAFLLTRIGHPVMWMGTLLNRLETTFNRWPAARIKGRLSGLVTLLFYLLICGGIAVTLTYALRRLPGGSAAEALLATSLIAQRDLYRYVKAVAVGLETSLAAGREAVSHIVGRDPEQLDESGVSRAALESLAENSSDGIIAPVFWLALLGLPGIVLYKAINTADSMIGHRSPRHLWFGWAAARLDDLVNLPCARLTGLFFAAAAALTRPRSAADALEYMVRDAGKHLSPNAGWPEAALAGALGIRLGGPRSYRGTSVTLAWMGRGRIELTPGDIRKGLRLYGHMLWIMTLILALTWFFSL